MPRDERHTATIPYGTLGIIPLASCTKMGDNKGIKREAYQARSCQNVQKCFRV